MPHEIVNHLEVIANSLIEDGVPRHIPSELFSKLRTAICAETDKIPGQASGHLYELLKWREIIHERGWKKLTSEPLDAKNVADILQLRNDGQIVATQAKWATGASQRNAYKNVNKAINQLSGAENENPPVGAVKVADVVIVNVPPEKQLSHEKMKEKISQVSHTAGIELRALQTEITVPGDPVTDLSTKTIYYSDDGVTLET